MNKKVKKGEYLDILLRSKKDIFSTKDVALLWGEENINATRVRLSYYVRKGKLLRVRRGLYVKDKNYNPFELATRIFTPSYISFETVLTRSGINFQYYSNIFVASYINREIKIGAKNFTFIRVKDYVLTNTLGIEHQEGYAIATKERAFLDRLYMSKDYHFDNLDALNWDKVYQILPIYNNKKMKKKVDQFFKFFRENQ